MRACCLHLGRALVSGGIGDEGDGPREEEAHLRCAVKGPHVEHARGPVVPRPRLGRARDTLREESCALELHHTDGGSAELELSDDG